MTKRELVNMLKMLNDDERIYIVRRGELFEICAGEFEAVRYDAVSECWVLKDGIDGQKRKKFVLDA